MLLILLAYLGGVLTILSPCVLPVLPFVFARADRPFVRSGLPLLVGMALTFAVVATLAAVGGGWAVEANRLGRAAALILLALFALTLVFPALADRAMQPLVRWGGRLSEAASAGTEAGKERIGPSLLLGVATGLLWAPCAGPILGIILTGAALSGATLGTGFLLLAYALGAATSLALALLVGGRVFVAMKRSIGVGQSARRVLGVLILVAVGAIALGLDTTYLTRLSTGGTFALEQGVANRLGGGDGKARTTQAVRGPGGAMMLPDEGALPSFAGVQWLNSPPLTREQLKGKVVLVDFWTYSCINCLRSIPFTRAWAERYGPAGLVVIGVHAPEFAFERDVGNVKRAMAELGIRYPVAVDNDKRVWTAFSNQYWPAVYIADAQGRLRYHHFGEGEDATTEAVIRQLLTAAGAKGLAGPPATVRLEGVGAQADFRKIGSHETYLGWLKGRNFASPTGFARDKPVDYALPPSLALNGWGLAGAWTVEAERARLEAAGGRIAFRFKARDLHLVMGAPAGVRFRVTLDGAAPGADHGLDTDAEGRGIVRDQRLYQLVRHQAGARERTFTIEFEAPGVEAYSFTFG